MRFLNHATKRRGEKISYHSGTEPAVKTKIGKAYLEFNRRWDQLTKDA